MQLPKLPVLNGQNEPGLLSRQPGSSVYWEQLSRDDGCIHTEERRLTTLHHSAAERL